MSRLHGRALWRKALINVGFTFAFCLTAANAQDAVDTAWSLPRTTFLSTEPAEAMLTVSNHSNDALRLETGQTTFDVYSQGRWDARPVCLRSCWRWFREIAPATTATVPIPLPSCAVYSDPCSVTAVAHYTTVERGEAHTYAARLPAYRFVPDPTATYTFPGLRDDRPVFVATGTSHDIMSPQALIIEIVVPGTQLHSGSYCDRALRDDLTAALGSVGATSSIIACTSYGPNVMAKALTTSVAGKEDALAAALRALKDRPAYANASIAQSAAVDLGALPATLWQKIEGDARTQAQRIATTVGAAPLNDVLLQSGSPTYASTPTLSRQISDPPNLLQLDQETLSAVDLTVAGQYLYAAARRSNLHIDAALRRRINAASFWYDGGSLPPLGVRAPIAADRPQLYVLGDASVDGALAGGLDPDFAAIGDARAQAERLAAVMGVRLGVATLFAKYPNGAESSERSFGVAWTFSGAMKGMPSSASPGIRVIPSKPEGWESRAVPIVAPAAATTIAAGSEAVLSAPATRARLEVDVESRDVPFSSGDLREVLGRLRRLPHVRDAAVMVNASRTAAMYELALDSWDEGIVRGALGVVRVAHVVGGGHITFSLSPIERDCDAIANGLLKAGVQADWLAAQAQAWRSGHRLRKLLLVSALRVGNSELACAPLTQPPRPLLDSAITNLKDVSRVPSLSMATAVVYRTW